jgi:hypothetical protein
MPVARKKKCERARAVRVLGFDPTAKQKRDRHFLGDRGNDELNEFAGRRLQSGEWEVFGRVLINGQTLEGPLSMLWTAPPPARECHGCGCR